MTSYANKLVEVGHNEFIKKANKLYGEGKFDYSKSKFTGQFERLIIKCNSCQGEFNEKAHSHLCGKGCPLCEAHKIPSKKQISQEEFINRLKKKYGSQYDYSKIVYKGSDKPVTVHCLSCNEDFERKAITLASGRGCPTCKKHDSEVKLFNMQGSVCDKTHSQDGSLTTDISVANLSLKQQYMLKRAKEAHGDKYDYSEAVYTNSAGKLKVFCHACKHFFQVVAQRHFNGAGCPSCKRKESKKAPEIQMFNRTQYPKEEYIKRANMLHGEGTFDYSETVYTKTTDLIKFKCVKCHAVIERKAGYHLIAKKKGCPQCR